jgi:hypothetical protein
MQLDHLAKLGALRVVRQSVASVGRKPKDAELSRRVEQLRRSRMPMRRTAAQVGRSVATISRALVTLGLSNLAALDEPKPVLRYEH